MPVLADANDAHCFGHPGVQERQVLMRAMQALVQHHPLEDSPVA